MTEGLPQNWEKWSLAEVGVWFGGGTPSSTNADFWNGQIPWVSPKDMKANEITTSQDTITQAALDSSAAKLIPAHSVLFVTRSGILAHSFPVATNQVAVTVNQDLKAITPVEAVEPQYLTWLLRFSERQILSTCSKHGTTVHSIEIPALKRLKMPIPPHNEQRRIVAKIEELFSELDKSVEALTKARQQLGAYRRSLMDQATTGDLLVSRGLSKERFDSSVRKTLSQVVSTLGQGWSPRCLNHPSSSSESWAVITTTAIQHGSFDDRENKQLPDALDPRPHLIIQPGDILVTRAGPRKRVGVACLVRRCRSRLMLCDKAYRLRVDESKILPDWLELVLNSPRILQDVEELKTGISDSGVNLTQDRFLALRVPVPSLDAQRETLKIVDAASSHVVGLANQVDASLMHLDALRQSILKHAFSGQLVAQDPTDEPASVLLERIRAQRAGGATKKPGPKTKKIRKEKETYA